MEKSSNKKTFFRMRVFALPETNPIRRSVTHGILFYTLVIILSIPAVLCSQQHRLVSDSFSAFANRSGAYIQWIVDKEPLETNAAAMALLTDKGFFWETAGPFNTPILKAAIEYEIDPGLIRAIIAAESNFDPLAVSHRGARGLMQLMPDTAKSLGVTDIFDPGQNIDAGVRYLRLLLDRYAGDVRLALAAYNAGILRVRQYGGVPPYRATRLYIKKVLQYQNEFNSGMLPEDVRLPTI